MIKKMFNPFIYLAGGRALLIGLVAMLLTAVVSHYSNYHFDGIIDCHKHFGEIAPFYIAFAEQGIILVVTALLFYLAGRIFSKSSIRLVDVAGTLAFARWPMIFPSLLGFLLNKPVHGIGDITAGIIITGLLTMVFVIWLIALMYNAFIVSCNLKGRNGTMVFIGTLLVAEVAGFFLCHALY